MMNALESTSTRPYLIRALYDWCTDNGFTPYVAVMVDDSVQVPREYVKNGEIVLNVSFDATSSLKLGNDFIEFKARFAGSAREIMVPINRVIAIYARENGQGMAFPVAAPASSAGASAGNQGAAPIATPHPAALTSVPDRPAPVEDNVVPLSGAETPPVDDTDGDPPRPAPPSGARPSLKRIK